MPARLNALRYTRITHKRGSEERLSLSRSRACFVRDTRMHAQHAGCSRADMHITHLHDNHSGLVLLAALKAGGHAELGRELNAGQVLQGCRQTIVEGVNAKAIVLSEPENRMHRLTPKDCAAQPHSAACRAEPNRACCAPCGRQRRPTGHSKQQQHALTVTTLQPGLLQAGARLTHFGCGTRAGTRCGSRARCTPAAWCTRCRRSTGPPGTASSEHCGAKHSSRRGARA